jgi:GH24 family phage-related lysozyme (muramidase)
VSLRRSHTALVAAALALLLALPKRADDDDAVRVAKAFLVELEGVVLHEYDDGAGYATAGIGHRMMKGDRSPVTVRDALVLLDQDVKKHLPCIEKYRAVLEAWEFAALIAFVFNIG